MTERRLMAILAGLLALAARLPAAEQAAIPDLIRSQVHGVEQTLWIAAEVAVRADGSVNLDLFDPFTREWVAREAAALRANHAKPKSACTQKEKEEDCDLIQVTFSHPQFDLFVPEQLLALAKSAVVGRVVGARQGFIGTSPGTLLAVVVDRDWLVPSGRGGAVVLVPFWASNFAFERERLCVQSRTHPEAPAQGKGVLFFAQEVVQPSEGVTLLSTGDLFFEGSKGQVVGHPLMLNTLGASKTWAEFIEIVERRLALSRR